MESVIEGQQAPVKAPASDFKMVGDILKKRRTELNLSLKEVENGTSIREVHLKSIEEGNWDKLIAPIYAQGFYKQYASFLGMDGEKILKEHSDIISKPDPQDFAYGIGTLEHRGHPGAGVKWVPNALWIVVFIVGLLAAWYFARFFEVI